MATTIVRTPWIDDDGSGTTGTVLNNAVKTELYDQIDGALAAVDTPWVDKPYNAADFTASDGATWTVAPGSYSRYSYRLQGRTLVIQLYLTSTTVAGSPAILYVAAPVPVSGFQGGTITVGMGSTPGIGNFLTQATGSTLPFLRDIFGTPWPAGNLHLVASLTLQVA